MLRAWIRLHVVQPIKSAILDWKIRTGRTCRGRTQ